MHYNVFLCISLMQRLSAATGNYTSNCIQRRCLSGHLGHPLASRPKLGMLLMLEMHLLFTVSTAGLRKRLARALGAPLSFRLLTRLPGRPKQGIVLLHKKDLILFMFCILFSWHWEACPGTWSTSEQLLGARPEDQCVVGSSRTGTSCS